MIFGGNERQTTFQERLDRDLRRWREQPTAETFGAGELPTPDDAEPAADSGPLFDLGPARERSARRCRTRN